MNTLIRMMLSIAVVLTVSGCAATSSHMYEGPERPLDQVATVKAFGGGGNVIGVNGNSPGYYGTLAKIYLLPGEYTFDMRTMVSLKVNLLSVETKKANGKIQFKVEAGHTYVIRGEIDGDYYRYSYADKGKDYPEKCFDPALKLAEIGALGCY